MSDAQIRELPARRACETVRVAVQHMDVGKLVLNVSMGFYEDGRLGEVFITLDKHRGALARELDGAAIQISHSLQLGVPLDVLYDQQVKGDDGEPETFVGHAMRAALDHINSLGGDDNGAT